MCAGLDVDSSLKHDTPHTIILVKRFDNLETINVDDSDEGDSEFEMFNCFFKYFKIFFPSRN